MALRIRRVLTAAGAVIVAVGLGYVYLQYLNARDYLKNPARVAFILNISELPPSVRDIECSSRAITDIIVSCAFRVDPRDFESLMSGWLFKSEKVRGDGRAYGMDAPVGPSFPAVIRHFVYPASFKNGGLVNVVTNRDQTLVVANRFEE